MKFISSSFIQQPSYILITMSASGTRKRSTNNNKAEEVAQSFSDSAKRQVGDVGNVAKDAVVSGTWAYPLLVSYFVQHFW